MTNLAGVISGSTPMTPALCLGLGVASLYPIVWHAPEWWNISDHSAPALEWPERDVPENEESHA